MKTEKWKMLGIVRQIDATGRVCLPKEFLNTLNISAGDPVEIKLVEDEKGEKKILISEVKENEMVR